MSKIIIKRDSREVDFDINKIKVAISKAMISSNINDDSFIEDILIYIVQDITLLKEEKLLISEIQNIIELNLIKGKYPLLAQKYISYRLERDKIREFNSELIKSVNGLINQNDISILNENANKDSKLIPTQRDLLAGILAKHYAKKYILSDDIVQAHERGEIHYHDLDYAPFFPMFNCMLVDLEGMLTNGFNLGNAEIEEPKSIGTATAITAQIIAQVASNIYGGTTINGIDTILAKYVNKSYEKHLLNAGKWNIPNPREYANEMIKKECYDAFQSLEYEINTLHTSNGQTPFVTLGFGLGESWQEKLIQQSILSVRLEGLGKSKKTAVFPKLVFAIKDGVNLKKEDPNYDIKQLAVRCATKRMYPDILNYEQVIKITGSFKTPMGCRSFLGQYINEEGIEEHNGRNNLGVVTINLPRIALETRNEKDFFNLLEKRLLIAKKALFSRIDRLRGIKAKIAPILYTEGACGIRLKPDDDIITLFEKGRASISLGYIGLHETVNALLFDDNHIFDSQEKKELSLRIMKKLKEAVVSWREESSFGFSLYSTPSENLCDRFCAIDKKEFGVVKGVTDKEYYTNSFHLDVKKNANPYEKINFEQVYPSYANGGFISYGEYPNLIHNPKALEDVWDYSYNKVPYYGTNTPVDQCYECGFSGEFNSTSKGFSCPQCGNNNEKTVSVIRRVCGYLGSPNSRAFNKGKQDEVIHRVKHLNNNGLDDELS